MKRPQRGKPSAGLPPETASLVRLSAALAVGDGTTVETELRAAIGQQDPAEVEEAIVQSCLFLGFPTALDAAATWRRIRGEAAGPDTDPLASAEHGRERAERGEQLCRTIYGSAYDDLRRNVAAASPALDRLMVETGYGRVLGRPGLDRVRRELCLVAILSAQGRDRQLHSHLRGALRVGAPPEWVEASLEIGMRCCTDGVRKRLRRLWREVADRCARNGVNNDVR